MSAAEFLRSTRESLVLVFWKPGSTKQRRLDIFAVPSAWNVARPLVVPLVHSVAPRRPLVVSIAQTSIATPLAPPPLPLIIGRATWNNVWGSWSSAHV
ncbi:hypothetical protein E4U11_003343 [Claviceps purpurea]|nr:hypothetical protein E4U11_003343 [Claviceps purpurea]